MGAAVPLPQSANVPVELAAVNAELHALEQLCNELEMGLRTQNWERLDGTLRDSRRTMHAFENAMVASRDVRSVEFDREVYARLQRIYAVREQQMSRLKALHDAIGQKLQTFSRWKAYARSIGGSSGRRRGVSLLDDVR